MDAWVESAQEWEGFNKLSKGAKSAFEDLMERTPKIQDKRTFNILLMGKSCVGKSSTIENIVKMGNFLPDTQRLEKGTLETMSKVFSFTRGDFTLNFIDTEHILDTGGLFEDSLLCLTSEFREDQFIDVILYVDRADVYSMNATDLMVAKAITELFGEKAWNRVLIVLTHCDALEGSTEKDFGERRKAELLNWIVKGGDIKNDVEDTLKGRVVFIDNAKKINEPKSVEEINDDDDLAIATLIRKIADIARDNKGLSLLAEVKSFLPNPYDKFAERIFEDCQTKYFEMINNVNNPEGEQKEWRSFRFDEISRTNLLPDFEPVEWKTDHLPQSAMQSIENIKRKGNSFTILVMGRCGVGKSSTANSVIGEKVFPVNKVKGSQEIFLWSGSTSDFTLRIIEIPGFLLYGHVHPEYFEAIKLFWNTYEIDALLYVERLDEWKRDDLMSKTTSNFARFFGPKILNRALIVLTHSTSLSKEQFERQFDLRIKLIKDRMLQASSFSRYKRGMFEVNGVKAVAVENCEKYPAGHKIKQEWIAELFAGLDGIYQRQCLYRSIDHLPIRPDDLGRQEWPVPNSSPFFIWYDRDYTEELQKNVRVMLLFHVNVKETDKGEMDPTPKRLKSGL